MPTFDPRAQPSWSDWCIPINAPSPNPTAELDRLIFTHSGQGALFQIFRELARRKGARVLLPAFHCPTVVEPAVRAGLSVDFYDIQLDLRAPAVDLREVITDEHAAIVVINYFGFDFDIDSLAGDGPRPFLIEDCCHSFLRADGQTLTGNRGDLAVFSFKKLLPSRVGGAIRVNNPEFTLKEQPGSCGWVREAALFRRILGQSWSATGHARMSNHAPVEQIMAPVESPSLADQYPFEFEVVTSGIPRLARRIIGRSDWRAVARGRRENYAAASAALADCPSITCPLPDLAENCCPWGFPILLEDRKDHDYHLKNRGVPFFSFGETLHPQITALLQRFPSTERLHRQLVFLAVHQQLTPGDVAEYCREVRDYFERPVNNAQVRAETSSSGQSGA